MVAELELEILLAEDSEDDVYLIKRAIRDEELPFHLTIATDGVEAMEMLAEKSSSGNLPKLILLDVNMPRMNGFEVLDAVKADPQYRQLPVVMLTSSSRDEDILQSYAKGASSYISKPSRYQEFRDMIANFSHYWTNIVTLP
ncbi:MAG: hypothetical protein CMO55_16430 [Verrucomicrobiales bacterium]|nr:hypothetical protein [Verrucomicrobiales bacterium]